MRGSIKVNMVRKSVLLSIISIMVLVTSVGTTFASSMKIDKGTLTPPPVGYQINGIFNPNLIYLESGSTSIVDNKNETVTINVVTESRSVVESLGGRVFLQQWTGSTWNDVGSATTLSSANNWYFSGEVNKSAQKGYYYRTRVVHFSSHNGVYEQEETISGYILVN